MKWISTSKNYPPLRELVLIYVVYNRDGDVYGGYRTGFLEHVESPEGQLEQDWVFSCKCDGIGAGKWTGYQVHFWAELPEEPKIKHEEYNIRALQGLSTDKPQRKIIRGR